MIGVKGWMELRKMDLKVSIFEAQIEKQYAFQNM